MISGFPLSTSRLIVRPFVESDLAAVARIHDECFGEAPQSARRSWLDWTVRNYEALAQLGQPPYGDYAVELRQDGTVIGAVGLVPSFGPFEKLPAFRKRLRAAPSERFTPEVGLFWAIDVAHRRSGYATEAAGAMMKFAFEQLSADRLVATTEHENLASMGVMRKIGMTIETNPDPEPAWFQVVGVKYR